MTLRFLHLFPNQLNLNGEVGNLDCLIQRLKWAGIYAEVLSFDGSEKVPSRVDAVFIGSGTLAGALEALEKMTGHEDSIRELSSNGTPFLALGLGWEILGQSVSLEDGTRISGLRVFPSKSSRTKIRASAECFGYDGRQNLTTGYANHSAEIELLEDAKPWITLSAGFGNSSIHDSKTRPDEGLISGSLFGARLNGPLLPLNPHLADEFLTMVGKTSGFTYLQESELAKKADYFAANAREELRQRLAR